jgi:hypothetical protein
MTRLLPLLLPVVIAALLPAAPAFAQADPAKAAERCEKEVADTIRRLRGRDARDVQFVAARRVLLPGGEDETSVRGEGRYRAASGASISFTYGCAYSAATDATSGVVFRDLGAARAASEKAFEPDLSNVSPEACESAAAAALKKQHPRVARINFGSDSRRMQPGENGRIELLGQGSVERASGMNLIPFSYRCEVEPRSGRIVAISTRE